MTALRALAAVLVVGLAAARLPAQRTTVLTDVTVVDVEAGTSTPHRTLVLYGGRIDRMGPDGEGAVPEGAERVDAGGRWLIPGLWDAHVHDVEDEDTLPLYLAHGVTAVRAMGGDGPAAISARDRVATLELRGPRILAAGPFLDGRADGDVRWELAGADDVEDALGALFDLGADFAKVHDLLPADAFARLMEIAPVVDLPVAGHVPRGVSWEEAAAAGMTTIEHANQLAERLLTKEAAASDEALDAHVDALLADGGRAAALADALVASGTAFVPTLVAHEGILRGADPESGAWGDPRLARTPAGLVDDWREMLPVDALPEGFVRERRIVHRAATRLVGGLHARGVTILAGSDVGAPHVHPGSSLHDELEALVACGLTPAEALRAATRAPAVTFGLADQLGQIVPGRIADLVLLDADPLEDIGAVRRVHAVFVRGAVLDRQALDGMLEAAASRDEPAGGR